MNTWLAACDRDRAWLIDLIRALVECESPSTDRVALDACAAIVALRADAEGAAVERMAAGSAAADHVLARWPGDGPPVLVLGHCDTVWPVGQIARMPVHETGGRLYGPGIFDMKAGLGIGLLAIRTLVGQRPVARRPRVTLLVTTDEEVGSGSSRRLIERLALESSAVLVLEPALAGGAVKTARKGVGEFEVELTGVSSHAGVDPGGGASAISELARVIARIEALADHARGVFINVGVVEGGTRPNVVAEYASARVDVRVSRLGDLAVIEAAFAALRSVDPRVALRVSGGMNRPPMERSAGVERLYELARGVARELGRELGEGATGGGSDGNFTAALGVPTLDGLGATGDGAHALHEHVIVNDLPWRSALLAAVMARLSDVG
jgi:glutamate carboxypeptidase